jgi:hypothetical protein
MKAQLNNLAFWVGTILLVILVTVFYQPAAAKTGSLVVWQDGGIYVLNLDSLKQEWVGTAAPKAVITPSPGCLGQVKVPCWVAAGTKLYLVGAGDTFEKSIPLETGARWLDAAVSWSPDGLHLAYPVLPRDHAQIELRVHNAASGETRLLASGIDPGVAVAWTAGCIAGLEASACQVGYKLAAAPATQASLRSRPVIPAWADELPAASLARPFAQLATMRPLTGEQQTWPLPVEAIFELRWTADNTFLYSQPEHYFHRVRDNTPAYQISPGSQLANMSPNGRFTIYYEPFTQKECQAERPKGGCWYLGIWLADGGPAKVQRSLLYSRELSQAGAGRLNADPFWSPRGDAFVLVREGQLIYYNLKIREAASWYQSLRGQLTSAPAFSPQGEALALAYHDPETPLRYHLLVINPQFKPLEHIIDAQEGFRVLAWLPHQLY